MSELLVIVIVAVTLLGGYIGVVGVLWMTQERIVFQPPWITRPTPASARQVRYRAADGVELFAYVVGDCRAQNVMIAFHGNADLARWLIPWASTVTHETGLCVVLAEYRGYDDLPGKPTYPASSLDATAAWTFVHDTLGVPTQRMVFFGHSLGTAVAAELAIRRGPRALILQAPFTSARDMARRMWVPGLVYWWRLISRVHFDTRALVQNLAAPVWVSHGERDWVVQVHMGCEVFAHAHVQGELLLVPGAGHNDVAEVGGATYWRWLRHACVGGAALSAPDARSETRPEP